MKGKLIGVRSTQLLLIATCAFAASTARASSIRFTDVTKSSGIDFTMTCGKMPSREIIEVNGGGVALFDYDKDGDLDLFLANGATMDDPVRGPGSRLYANRGDGSFEDVTHSAGIDIRRWAMGVAVGDYNADGWDDLYINCYGPNVLLRNEPADKDGRRFVDVTEAVGVGDARWGTSAAFGDIDGDGDLDLYVVNYLVFDCRNPPDRAGMVFKNVPVMAGPAGLTPDADVLYENLGEGRFRDITEASGCTPTKPGYGLGVRILDLNGDGKQDIFVGNDSTENFLFRNKGNRRFEEAGVIAGVASNYEGANQATMGIAIGDVDGNGFADLFSTNFSSDTNTLHMHFGDGFYDDRTSQYGLAMVSRPFLSWGCGFYDFDCDGDEDLFIASGHVYPEAATHAIDSEYQQPPMIFERRGPRFGRVQDAGDMFERKYSGRATAFGDIDSDGDVDIIMLTLNGPVLVFRNDAKPKNAIVVELADDPPNHRCYGGKVELETSAGVQRRWITGGGSYQSADAPAAYFAIPASASKGKRSLRVSWPDGKVTTLETVEPNRRIILRKDNSSTPLLRPLRGR